MRLNKIVTPNAPLNAPANIDLNYGSGGDMGLLSQGTNCFLQSAFLNISVLKPVIAKMAVAVGCSSGEEVLSQSLDFSRYCAPFFNDK
jgi:hypothetical protein